MCYCCKDYKSIARGKKFLRRGFFVCFGDFVSSFLKFKKFFLSLNLESSISRNERNLLRVGFFFHFSSSESYFLKQKRNIKVERSISRNIRKFRWPRVLNIPFQKYKEISVMLGFSIYLSRNIRKFVMSGV